MAEDIMLPDGRFLTPINMADHLGITQEQLNSLSHSLMHNPMSVNYDSITKKQQEMADEIATNINEGRQDFIREMAQATAEENAKAMRSSPFLLDEIIGVLSDLCGNRHYNSSSNEDTINDYVRDMLGRSMQVRDQTRQGRSGNSRTAEKGQAGEIDIQIRNNGRPIGIYEGLRLESVVEKTIHEHIAKATVNYNPQGVKEVFIVAYIIKQTTGFGDFWSRLSDCIRCYEAENSEYRITWDSDETDIGLSAVRELHGVYKMDGVEHDVHMIAVKIQE